MRSKSDRLPRFPPMPVSGPPVQTNPLVFTPRIGLPAWLNLEGFRGKCLKPFYSTAALAEYANSCPLHPTPEVLVEMDKQAILEVRARANPWHPSGRLEKLIIKQWIEADAAGNKTFLVRTLKFNGDGEQVECVSAYKLRENAPVRAPLSKTPVGKYRGPRTAGDSTVTVSGNIRKRS